MRKPVASLSGLVLLMGLLGTAPASAQLEAIQVGETDLFNFEHVRNIPLVLIDENQPERAWDNQSTDIEFFTTDAVVRDADGVVVGADGVAGNDDDTVAVPRDFAVVGDHSDGMAIIDITDPESAYVADYIICGNPRSDVGVHQIMDGGTLRTFIGNSREGGVNCQPYVDGQYLELPPTTVASSDSNPLTNEYGGFAMFEVTDPYDAQPFADVRVGAGGAHNFIFHPTEPIAYAWNGEIGGAEVTSIQIVDFTGYFATDPAARSIDQITSFVGPTTLGSPHDGELSPDGSRMYVASEFAYLIFDNTDPLDPQLTTEFAPNPGTYAHGYFPTPDGNLAITNNESLAIGGFFADQTGICPGEGLGIYDTSSDVTVGPLSYFAPPVQGQTPDHRACTSHFGRVAPNNMVMSVGWYILGGRVIDFSVPALPVEIGAVTISREDSTNPESPWFVHGSSVGTEAWSAKFYKGAYMYVGDRGRGFDVYRWTGPAACGNPFGTDWVGVDACEGLEYRLPLADPSTLPGTTDAPTRAGVPLAPALVLDAITRMDEEGFELRYSCQL